MYYGIDLHPTAFTVCWIEADRKSRTKTYYFQRHGLKEFKERLTKEDVIAIESTVNSYYFYDELTPLVKEVKIINPGQFAIICASSSKTDKKDARAILNFLEKDMLPEITIPSKEIRELRGLFATYTQVVRMKTKYKNRLQAILKGNGIFLSAKDVFSAKGRKELEKRTFSSVDNYQVKLLMEEIDRAERQGKDIKQTITEFSLYFPKELSLLTTIPGISLFIGLAIISDIADIKNFTNSKKLCSYLGIVPFVSNSNGKTKTGKITKRGRKTARTFLSEVIFHFIRSSEIYTEFYDRKKRERGAGKAIVAMMRKLVVIIYHMLTKEEDYYYMNKELHEKKLKEWLKMINFFKTLDATKLQKMEHEGRLKYDMEYAEKIKEKLCNTT